MRSLSRKAQLLSSSAPQLISPSVLSFTILQAFSTPSSAFQLASRAPPPVTLQHLCSSRPEWLNGSPPMCLSVPRLLRISAPRAHMFSMSASAPEGDDPWYSAGLRFSCSLCGNCCSGKKGSVSFTEVEGQAMADQLKLSNEAFLSKYAKQNKEGIWKLKEVKRKKYGWDCILLDRRTMPGKAVCSVYGARPVQCRTWPFWNENLNTKDEWEWASEDCPGINKGELHDFDHIERCRLETEL